MTTIVAAKKNNKIVIASDSLTTLESKRLINVQNDPKIIKFNNFTIAACGDGPIIDILEHIRDMEYPDDEYSWADHKLNTREDCTNFILNFIEKFQERSVEMNAEDLKYEFLFTNYDKIWWGLTGPSILEVDKYWACGSGADYAIGYMEAKFSSKSPIEKVVHDAIQTAIKFDSWSGAPVVSTVYEIQPNE